MHSTYQPLASLLRPTRLDQFVGQSHLLGAGAPLAQMLQQNMIYSMIFWGPPGCGKTSIVEIIKQHVDAEFISLSAISAGVKEIREAISSPNDLFNKQKLVFVDEIHRFNKAQQDAFLPFVESGTIVLIGATTENPSFSINRALLSRARVFVLEPLTREELTTLFQNALDYLEQKKAQTFEFEQGVINSIIEASEGDARRMLTTLEIATDSAFATGLVTRQLAVNALGVKQLAYDKQGDAHYDLLSAFHKSVRGSSVDGALYWFARLLKSNPDITPIARRLLAIATEDIGNADPKAIQICLNAWEIYHRVGDAEGQRAIAQAVIYVALAPKSNAVYTAFKSACKDVESEPSYPVPNHLRNAPTKLAKEMGHGAQYQHAHNHEHAYVANERYMPEALEGARYYQPNDRGFEKVLKQKMRFLSELDAMTTVKDKF